MYVCSWRISATGCIGATMLRWTARYIGNPSQRSCGGTSCAPSCFSSYPDGNISTAAFARCGDPVSVLFAKPDGSSAGDPLAGMRLGTDERGDRELHGEECGTVVTKGFRDGEQLGIAVNGIAPARSHFLFRLLDLCLPDRRLWHSV